MTDDRLTPSCDDTSPVVADPNEPNRSAVHRRRGNLPLRGRITARRSAMSPKIVSATAFAVAVCTVVVAIILSDRSHRAPAEQPTGSVPHTIDRATTPGTATASSKPRVRGITNDDPVGTCYKFADTTTSVTEINAVDCVIAHDYELFAHEQAQGSDAQYPTADYWTTTIGGACRRELISYAALRTDALPAGLTIDVLRPLRQPRATGDRSVICLARSNPATRGSLKQAARPTHL